MTSALMNCWTPKAKPLRPPKPINSLLAYYFPQVYLRGDSKAVPMTRFHYLNKQFIGANNMADHPKTVVIKRGGKYRRVFLVQPYLRTDGRVSINDVYRFGFMSC